MEEDSLALRASHGVAGGARVDPLVLFPRPFERETRGGRGTPAVAAGVGDGHHPLPLPPRDRDVVRESADVTGEGDGVVGPDRVGGGATPCHTWRSCVGVTVPLVCGVLLLLLLLWCCGGGGGGGGGDGGDVTGEGDGVVGLDRVGGGATHCHTRRSCVCVTASSVSGYCVVVTMVVVMMTVMAVT